MKKIAVLAGALTCGLPAFAMSDDPGIAIFVSLAALVISIIILVRWWGMTTNVKKIAEIMGRPDSKITYLVAIGEAEQAQKSALKMMVDNLYSIYNSSIPNKGQVMDDFIAERLPRIQRMGLEMPTYVTSGQRFIDYMNGLTGRNVKAAHDAQ